MKAGVTRPVKKVIPSGQVEVLSNIVQTFVDEAFGESARQAMVTTRKVRIVRKTGKISKALQTETVGKENLQPTSWTLGVRLMANKLYKKKRRLAACETRKY